MNKKGFTLIELLAVIVVLGIIITLGVVSVTGIRKKMNENLLSTKIKMLESAAKLYGEDNKTTVLAGENNCITITVLDLVSGNYIDYNNNNNTVVNPVDNSNMLDSEIIICYENNQMTADFQEEIIIPQEEIINGS